MTAVLDPATLPGLREGLLVRSAQDGLVYLLGDDGQAVPMRDPRGLAVLDAAQLTPIGGDWFVLNGSGDLYGMTPAAPAVIGDNGYEGQVRGLCAPGGLGYVRMATGARRLAPGLRLDFLSSETPDPRIVFAGGVNGTRTNAAGAIVAAAAPRFDYDPVTHAAKGLLMEEARTRLNTLALAPVAPEAVAVTAQAYTVSFYGAGTVTLSGAHAAVVAGLGAYPARKTYTFTPAAGALTMTPAGSVNDLQLEAGSFATSVIRGEGATVARTTDTGTLTGANFAAGFNAAEGAVCVSASLLAYGGAPRSLVAISDGTASHEFYAFVPIDGIPHVYVNSAAALQADLYQGAAIVAGTPFKLAWAYKANDFALSRNGAAAVTDVAGALPVVNRLTLGARGTGGLPLSGHIRAVSLIPGRVSNATLAQLSA